MALSVASTSTTTTGTSATPTVNVPSGVAAGEGVLVVFHTNNAQTINVGASGFVHAPGSPLASPGVQFSLNVLFKVATGNDTGTYAFTTAGSDFWAGAASRITGGPSATWDTNSGTGTALVTSASANSLNTSMTTQAANELLIGGGDQFNGGTWTFSGLTKIVDIDAANKVAGDAALLQTAAGATGTITNATAGAASQMVAWLGALVPAGTAQAPVDVYRATFVVVAGKLRALRQIARGYRPDTTQTTSVQADSGVAEVDQRSSTGAAGVKGGQGAGVAIAHPATSSTTTKGGQGTGRPSARAVTNCVGVKGGQGTGAALARNTTRSTAAKGATGTGAVVQHSTTTAAKATTPTGTGLAPQHSTTSSATLKGGIGSGRPSAHVTTGTAGRHQGIATAGNAIAHPTTKVTAAKAATGTGRPTQHSTTSVVAVQVAAFTPAYVTIDGAGSTGGLDGAQTAQMTDGAASSGGLDSAANTGAQEGATTAAGYV